MQTNRRLSSLYSRLASVPALLCRCMNTLPYLDCYHTWKKLDEGKIGKFGKSWAIWKKFPHQYSQIHQNVFGVCTDFSLFAKFFLANSFYLYGLPKISPAKVFACTVYLLSLPSLLYPPFLASLLHHAYLPIAMATYSLLCMSTFKSSLPTLSIMPTCYCYGYLASSLALYACLYFKLSLLI